MGTYKSFFVGYITNPLFAQDVPMLMPNFPTILNHLTEMSFEDRSEFIANFDKYDLLIIDELDAWHHQPSGRSRVGQPCGKCSCAVK